MQETSTLLLYLGALVAVVGSFFLVKSRLRARPASVPSQPIWEIAGVSSNTVRRKPVGISVGSMVVVDGQRAALVTYANDDGSFDVEYEADDHEEAEVEAAVFCRSCCRACCVVFV
jgi:hypothetical protein